jgi:hypothetical protein
MNALDTLLLLEAERAGGAAGVLMQKVRPHKGKGRPESTHLGRMEYGVIYLC